jgi:hypothetical protein
MPFHLSAEDGGSLSIEGEHLLTADGTVAVADGGTTPKVHDGWMWDLTVPGNGDHDFYVLSAQASSHHTYHVEAGLRLYWFITILALQFKRASRVFSSGSTRQAAGKIAAAGIAA